MIKEQFKNRIKIHRNENVYMLPKKTHKEYLSTNVKEYLGKLASNGRIWGSSYNLSNLRGGTEQIDEKILNEIDRLQNLKTSKRIDKKHYSLVLYKEVDITKTKYPELYRIFHDFNDKHFSISGRQTLIDDFLDG
jgi:hypothetical protein